MPKRPSKGWQEPFIGSLAGSGNVDEAAALVGVRRDTAHGDYRQDAVFADCREAGRKWGVADGVREVTLVVREYQRGGAFGGCDPGGGVRGAAAGCVAGSGVRGVAFAAEREAVTWGDGKAGGAWR